MCLPPFRVCNCDGDSGADRGPIALHPDQLQRNPIVSMPRVFKQPHRMAVGGGGAADLGDDVFVAIVVEIGEGNAMALVQFASAR